MTRMEGQTQTWTGTGIQSLSSLCGPDPDCMQRQGTGSDFSFPENTGALPSQGPGTTAAPLLAPRPPALRNPSQGCGVGLQGKAESISQRCFSSFSKQTAEPLCWGHVTVLIQGPQKSQRPNPGAGRGRGGPHSLRPSPQTLQEEATKFPHSPRL